MVTSRVKRMSSSMAVASSRTPLNTGRSRARRNEPPNSEMKRMKPTTANPQAMPC